MYFLAARAAHYADGGVLGGVPSSGLFFGVSGGFGAADSGVDSAEGDGVSACNSGGIFNTTFDCQLKTVFQRRVVRSWQNRNPLRVAYSQKLSY